MYITYNDETKVVMYVGKNKPVMYSNGLVLVSVDTVPATDGYLTYENGEFIQHNYERKTTYKQQLIAEIRKKYTIDDELAIIRQKDAKPAEFAEYNNYVETCKNKFKDGVSWL